jgi:hypothetical protein
MFPLLNLSSLEIIKRLIEVSHDVGLTPMNAYVFSITSSKCEGKKYQLLKKEL